VRPHRRTAALWFLPLACVAALTCSAAAQGAPDVDLRSAGQRSTRHSAYSLPKGTWSIDVGALGMGDELYGMFGGGYGLGKGVQLELNLAHYATGLFNINARWNFLDLEHFGLGLGLGFDYGHGDWVWVLDPAARELIRNTDLFAFPLILTASAPLNRWLQLDLSAGYQHAVIVGELGNGSSFYTEAQIGARQLWLQPVARAFLSNDTALELTAYLPAYTRVPFEGEISVDLAGQGYSRSGDGEAKVPFSEAWNFEVGLRTAIRDWLFWSLRLDLGPRAELLYGAFIYPAFSVEFRL
jgi:hypothetical protein